MKARGTGARRGGKAVKTAKASKAAHKPGARPKPTPKPKPVVGGPPPAPGLPPTLTAAQLAPLVNGYSINPGPPLTITVPQASQLAALQDVTVSGQLLNRQMVTLDPKTNKRMVKVSGGGGYTKQEQDGDLHFALGVKPLQPHIACELQNAAAWIQTFNAARGKTISVSGFFRCLFEHPGFKANDDAHIFEIHPVRAVNLSGSMQSFNVDIPVQKEIHTWTNPIDLNKQDGRITVKYDAAKDTLTFTGMDGRDENYIQVSDGTVTNVRLSTTPPTPSRFTFTSQEIGHAIEVIALTGTTAERQLSQLKATNIKLIGLRNVDFAQALKGRYVINLLAIDIQPH